MRGVVRQLDSRQLATYEVEAKFGDVNCKKENRDGARFLEIANLVNTLFSEGESAG